MLIIQSVTKITNFFLMAKIEAYANVEMEFRTCERYLTLPFVSYIFTGDLAALLESMIGTLDGLTGSK